MCSSKENCVFFLRVEPYLICLHSNTIITIKINFCVCIKITLLHCISPSLHIHLVRLKTILRTIKLLTFVLMCSKLIKKGKESLFYYTCRARFISVFDKSTRQIYAIKLTCKVSNLLVNKAALKMMLRLQTGAAKQKSLKMFS